MPHSLRAKLSGLRYKGILEDKDYKRLCMALDNENVLEQISDEINKLKKVSDGSKVYVGINDVFDIIDKYRGGQNDNN